MPTDLRTQLSHPPLTRAAPGRAATYARARGTALREGGPKAPPGEFGPRERLRLLGAEALSDAELLAVLLGTGTRGEPVAVLAARLLSELGGLRGLREGRLDALRGLGPGKAARLRAALELGMRLATAPLHPQAPIRNSRDVHAALAGRLGEATAEHFVALALDARNRPVRQVTIAVGGLSRCALTPADAFRAVLREPAAGVIFVHNHPSGDPAPSDDDVAMTRRLVATGHLVGLRVLDHVVLGRDRYFSFLDAGLLDTGAAAETR